MLTASGSHCTSLWYMMYEYMYVYIMYMYVLPVAYYPVIYRRSWLR